MDIPLPPELMDSDIQEPVEEEDETLTTEQVENGDSESAVVASEVPSTERIDALSEEATESRQEDKATPRVSPSPGVTQGTKDPDVSKPTELKKLWKPVRSNPSDFTAWTVLLSYVEQQDQISFIREAYDGFFQRYPYCYGYWKKYNEMETKYGSAEQAEMVLEQGVAACPLSVELWIFYVDFSKERYKGVAGEGRIRELYERAIAAVGLDFKSDELWDVYAQWERSLGQHRNVVGIYERLIRIPTLHYRRHFDEFQQSLLVAPVKELISSEEYDTLVLSVPEGEDAEAFVRNMVIESRRTLYKETEKEASKRWTFEENIRRPYFHVRPLETNQLKNWNDYLDFEMAENQQSRIVFLFERCLVACALYEDFWRKYIEYLTKESLIDYVRYAYQRVCTFHLPSKTGLHLDWATLEEVQGNNAGALAALQNGLKHLPNKAILSLRQLGLTRRTQLKEASSETDEDGQAVIETEAVTEAVDQQYGKMIDEALDAGLAEFFLLKQAQYWLKVKGDKDKAMQILRAGLQRDPTSIPVLTALIDCELHQIPLNLAAVAAIFDEITEMDQLSPEQKAEFLERKICFLEDFSTDVRQIAATHQRYYEMTGKTNRGRKRAFGEVDTEDGSVEGVVPPAGVKPMHGQFAGPGMMHPPAGPVSGYFPPPSTMPAPMMAGAWPGAAPHPSMTGPGQAYPGYGAHPAHAHGQAPAWPGFGVPQQHHAPQPAWNHQAAVS